MKSPLPPLRCQLQYCGFEGGHDIGVLFLEEGVEIRVDGERSCLVVVRDTEKTTGMSSSSPTPSTAEGLGCEVMRDRLETLWRRWRSGGDMDSIQRNLFELVTGTHDHGLRHPGEVS